MKCQSDYDSEEQALVRQTDECVQEWWEGESHATTDGAPKVGETKQPVNAAEKRGFQTWTFEARRIWGIVPILSGRR